VVHPTTNDTAAVSAVIHTVARRTGILTPASSTWRDWRRLPLRRQHRIEAATTACPNKVDGSAAVSRVHLNLTGHGVTKGKVFGNHIQFIQQPPG